MFKVDILLKSGGKIDNFRSFGPFSLEEAISFVVRDVKDALTKEGWLPQFSRTGWEPSSGKEWPEHVVQLVNREKGLPNGYQQIIIERLHTREDLNSL